MVKLKYEQDKIKVLHKTCKKAVIEHRIFLKPVVANICQDQYS